MPASTTMLHREFYRPTDQRWSVASRLLLQSGYGSVSDLAEAIRVTNPQIIDWTRVAPGSIILVPFLPGGQ